MKAYPKKRSIFRSVIRGIFLILLVLVLLFLALFHKRLYGEYRFQQGRNILSRGAEGLTYSEQHLTQEQMLTDFEYLYQNCCTDSLVKEQAEKYLKIDYDSLYHTYKTRIEGCQDEYEFAAVMASFMAKLPGVHNAVFPPDSDLSDKSYFALSWELAFGNVRETNYAYWIQLEDRMRSYTQKSAVAYCGAGEYYFVDHDFGNEKIEEVMKGKLLTLNGEPTATALRKLDTIHKWTYDARNDCVRVANLIFNDGIGVPYEAEIEMPDGSIIKKTLYNSAEYNLAAQFRKDLYPEAVAEPETNAETDAETVPDSTPESTAQSSIKKCYAFRTDSSRKLVYVKSTFCDGSQADMFYEELSELLKETDVENIIIDMQTNSGGDFTFVTNGLCRAIFDHPTGWINYARFPKTNLTKLFYDQGVLTDGQTPEDMGDYIRHYEDFNAYGWAEKEYNIYVLISGSTFSSGDIFASIASEEDNVTLLGENTGGEGLTGQPLTYYLPESKFSFTFTPGVSEFNPDDNYVGTLPDIYCPMDWEGYLEEYRLLDDPEVGSEFSSLKYRPLWNRPYREALKLIDSRSDDQKISERSAFHASD